MLDYTVPYRPRNDLGFYSKDGWRVLIGVILYLIAIKRKINYLVRIIDDTGARAEKASQLINYGSIIRKIR